MFNGQSFQRLAYLWDSFLVQRGHEVWQSKAGNVLISRDKKGKRYRWMLLSSQGNWRRLTAIEHQVIERQLRLASRNKEEAYIVMEFSSPRGRTVVIPAERAQESGKITSARGGIDLAE